MRLRIRWLLLIAGLFLAPSSAFAQMDVPPSLITGPFSNNRPESGGLYVGFNFVYMNTNRTLKDQTVGIRGFQDLDGFFGFGINARVGSGAEALNVNDVRGPGLYQPGYDLYIGWKFSSGIAVELGWRHLQQAKYSAAAALLPNDFNSGGQFENTFLFAPVNNFGAEWAGNPQNIPVGTAATTFGIWNAASLFQIDYVQRYDIYTINVRVPIWQTDNHRSYGLFGPRIVWIWERFHWRTVDTDLNGFSGPDTTANYSNFISNRMYGVHAGFGNEWFLGSTPIGGFAFDLDIEGGLYVDLVKAKAEYTREDHAISSGRSTRKSALSPSFEVRAGVKWYVWEGITIDLGYDIQTYFNTIASLRPIDFNLSNVNPQYDNIFFRWYHGMRFGVTFSF